MSHDVNPYAVSTTTNTLETHQASVDGFQFSWCHSSCWRHPLASRRNPLGAIQGKYSSSQEDHGHSYLAWWRASKHFGPIARRINKLDLKKTFARRASLGGMPPRNPGCKQPGPPRSSLVQATWATPVLTCASNLSHPCPHLCKLLGPPCPHLGRRGA